MLVEGLSSVMVRGFCTEPPGRVSSETASALLRFIVTVSTIASRSPLSCCLSVRRTVVPTCRVTTSALAGVSTVTACCDTRGTSLSMTNRSPDSDAGSRAVPVPPATSVASRVSGTLRIFPAV